MTRQLGIEEFLVMFQILGSETIGMIGLLQGEASMNESGNAAPPAKPFDMLALLALFAREHQISLSAPQLLDQFMADARPRLEAALADDALIHGSRTERLFEATLKSFGRYRLLKSEDGGRVHGITKLRAPDFRVVLEDGDQWLIEVKNVRASGRFTQRAKMTKAYLESLEDYAKLVGTELKLAIFWSGWEIWTVVSPARFRTRNGGISLALAEAVRANEFARLGERIIATRPPLRLHLDASPTHTAVLGTEDIAHFTIGNVRLFSHETELTDPRDTGFAEVLFRFGDWEIQGPFARMDGDRLIGVEFIAEPEERQNGDLEGIGWASRIFSRYYAQVTVNDGKVVQLYGDAVPQWFSVLQDWDFESRKLPLMLGVIEPADHAAGEPSLEIPREGL